MMGLWADGWFYISSAGLLISGILFFFLLGQYRVASEAADATEGAEPSEAAQAADRESSSAIRPVYIPEESSSPKVVSHADAPEPKPEPKPRTEPEFTGPERRKDPANTTGGISPAVVYLQNIKVELADLHKDLRALSKRVDDELSSVSTRDEALIERLGELTRAVEAMKSAAPAPAAEPSAEPEEAPKPARKARKAEKPPEPEPQPAAEVVVEAPPPAAEVVLEAPTPAAEVSIEVLPPPPAEEPAPVAEVKAGPSPDETIRMELGALIAEPPVKAEAPAAAEPAAEPSKEEAPPVEKPRRGPVWPV